MPSLPRYLLSAIISSLFSFCLPAHAQFQHEGRVIDKNNKPVPYASVRLLRENTGSITDSSGNFQLRPRFHKKHDTLMISSVGFETLKLPVNGSELRGPFRLMAYSKKMEPVVVKSFSREGFTGSKTENVGFFRGWSAENKGGEIGKEISIPYKEYQLSKLRFKFYSPCDTVIIRVHIRDMDMDLPGAELISDSIASVFYRPAVADKSYEIDLQRYKIILEKKRLFIGLEVLKGNSGSGYCSVVFAGSEQGIFQYKSSARADWSRDDDFAIYMRLFVLHNEE
ncbi:MAG: carboxypeptidase-like regulatory domain-containing protein [Ferruginibacter sp.]